MLYLLDANVLIDANRDYYPIERVPEFWEWLVNMGENNNVKIPIEVLEELKEGDDILSDWVKDINISNALLLQEEAVVSSVSHVIDNGYVNDLTDDEIEKIGRDPFLISYALIDRTNRCLVTTENSKPSRIRANRHIPDVCNSVSVNCCNTFEFLRNLDFRTHWKSV